MATVQPGKENILKRIREALESSVPLPFPDSKGDQDIFVKSPDDDAIVFAEEFTKLGGLFSFCVNEQELKQQIIELVQLKGWSKLYCREQKFLDLFNLPAGGDLEQCDASITGCEYLVARTGSIVMSSAQESGRETSVYAPVHICIAYNHQLLFDIKDALSFLKEKYKTNFPSFITLATGASRTADIEKTLVTGVHGPKEVYCFLVEN